MRLRAGFDRRAVRRARRSDALKARRARRTAAAVRAGGPAGHDPRACSSPWSRATACCSAPGWARPAASRPPAPSTRSRRCSATARPPAATSPLARLARCQPWCDGGHDPVPGQLARRACSRASPHSFQKKSSMNDIRRTILWVIFGFSLVMLWDQWQVYNGRRPPSSPRRQRPPARQQRPARRGRRAAGCRRAACRRATPRRRRVRLAALPRRPASSRAPPSQRETHRPSPPTCCA